MAKKAKSGRDRRRRERSRRRPTRATRPKAKKRTQKPRHAGKATTKRDQRAYEDDPLGFAAALMKRFGEPRGREAFLKFVAENDPEGAALRVVFKKHQRWRTSSVRRRRSAVGAEADRQALRGSFPDVEEA